MGMIRFPCRVYRHYPRMGAAMTENFKQSDDLPENYVTEADNVPAGVFTYVLQCYRSTGGPAVYCQGDYDSSLGRQEIKRRLWEKAKANGCSECACSLL